MYLVINSDNIITGSLNYISNKDILPELEKSYNEIGFILIEISDEEFQEKMIGAIYTGGEDVEMGSPIELPVEEEVIIFPPMPSFGSPTGIK